MCHDCPVTRKVDYSALLYPVDRAEISAFKNEQRASRGSRWSAPIRPQTILFVAIAVALAVGILVLSSTSREPGSNSANLSRLVAVVILAVIVLAVIAAGSSFGGKQWETMLRLSRFAAANGLDYTPRSGDPHYPGSIFGKGESRETLNRLRATSGRALEIANYQYLTGSGRNRRVHRWGYLAMRLDRRLPHMILDARANNAAFGVTNLPTSFTKNQVLSLEGDFDRYFTLYCPREYERDALYVFTPDLMALLIDNASVFDVEIVDDWMLVYSATPFAQADPALYQRLFHIVDTVGAKTSSQSGRYVDDRIGAVAPNLVAPEGRRLRSGFSVGALAAFAIPLVLWFGFRFLNSSGFFGG